jgi:hypothetical protein
MACRRYLGVWLAALLPITLGMTLLATLGAVAGAQVLVDRSIALVNGHLVTWSDLDEEMRFEALENRRPLKDLTAQDRQEAFDQLVQNWILRDQMQGMFPASEKDVDARIAAIRAAWQMENDPARWDSTLQEYGITREELHKLAANQLEILRFLEFRVRPLVRVTRQEVDDYYDHTLAPQVEAQGQTPEPESELRLKIRQLLTEQKMNQEMEKWLDTLRSQAQVKVLWDEVQ